ncbi:putative acyl-CoA ligase [Camelimonas fluminis]|uniref:Acyl-CoA synthetase n=1 Tax=Camelimonas fluminis TaxID=1576911 RepID=A0ABV7UGQ3_9HYPH|nr:acyl-CoA synthetase [Camelimonas fluminis]GHE71525.1 putative acyl-CoA ligase [Camelimonas fluminis]
MPVSQYARSCPDRPALIFEPGGQTVSWGELETNSAHLANLFAGHGLGKGDHVAVLMENHPRFMEVVLAAVRSGLYVTPVNHHLTVGEVAYILVNCGARAIVTSPAHVATAGAALVDNAICDLRLVTGLDGAAHGFVSYEGAIAGASPDHPPQTAGDVMLYSSGTTGRPKGIKRPLPDGAFGSTADLAGLSVYGFDDQSVYLSPAPLYHAAPLGYVLAVLQLGGTVVVMERFDAEEALRLIEARRVTHSQWVPTMFVRMLKLPDATRLRWDLSSHRVAIHAAAPCPVEVKQRMIAWWGPILWEYYSSTERIGRTRIDSQEWLAHPGSVGRLAGAGAVHICDDDGDELPVGEAGVIYFEQPAGASFAYHDDPEKTAASCHPRHGDWLTVGDIGRLDSDGYLYLTDRKSFMIISGGVNIYPQAIEDALVLHPAVADVAVIGVPHPEMGEEVRAIVQLQQGEEGDDAMAARLLAFLDNKVARYALPRVVAFMEELPRLPTGKLYKKALRDQYLESNNLR